MRTNWTDLPRPATVRVDLDALARNYLLFSQRAAPAECAAVVKADAYGLGAERVVRRLLREGCKRFFVATAAEAREVRAIAREAEIAVFEGALASTVQALVDINARPVLNTLEQIER
jgi:alanine racemase